MSDFLNSGNKKGYSQAMKMIKKAKTKKKQAEKQTKKRNQSLKYSH